MGRDLSFWKTSKKDGLDNTYVYSVLSSGKYLDYIDEIPIDEIQRDFSEVFMDWENYGEVNYEKSNESFQLMLTNQFVRADCSGMTEMNMNKIIDILLKYNCPLYDSAINIRFDGTQ